MKNKPKQRFALYTLAASAMAAAALISGCASLGAGSARNIPLAYAPAETAFAFGNLERMPQAYQALNTRWMNTLHPSLLQTLARLQEVLDDSLDDAQARQKSHALLDLLHAKLSQPEGFASIGLDLNNMLAAFYEIHALPVLRLELADPAKFNAFMDEAQAKLGPNLATGEIQGQRYWHFAGAQPRRTADDRAADDATAQPARVRSVVAVVGKHLVITLDMQREDAPLASLLGLSRPAKSLVDSGAIAAINQQYGYLNGGATGFVDTQRLLARTIGDGQTPTWLSQAVQDQLHTPLDATCRSELQSLAAKAPRLVGGATQLDGQAVRLHALLEMPAELAQDLSALPAPVAGLGTVPGNLVFGGGVHAGAAASFLQKQLSAVKAAPYRCAYLTPLNELALESAEALAFLSSASDWLQGLRVEFSKLDLAAETFSGTLLLASANPSALLGMVQSFVPELAGLNLKSDGVASKWDIELPTDESIWLAMSSSALGAALGEADKDKLSSLLKAPALATPPLLYMEANGSAYVDMLSTLTEDALAEQSTSEWEDLYNYVTWPLTAASIALYKDLDTVKAQWLLTPRGMEMTQEMVVKAQP